MLSEYTARNNKHRMTLLPFPEDVLKNLNALSEEVVLELVAKDPMSKKIYTSVDAFRKQVSGWSAISEQAFFKAREL